jgi:hypothetical protein
MVIVMNGMIRTKKNDVLQVHTKASMDNLIVFISSLIN